MFSINDTVIYGSSGVCKIDDIREEKFGKEKKTYYILKPVYDEKSTIYCPVDSDKIRMRKLLSADEIRELITVMPDTQADWIFNDQLRKEEFNAVLKRGDPREIIGLIKALYLNREEKSENGKKFHSADEAIMKEAERVIYGEFAHVLDIKPDEVVDFITGQLEAKEKQSI